MSETSDDIKDGEFAAGRMAFMCEGVGPELVTFPAGSQIFPNTYDEVWEIVVAVNTREVAYEYAEWQYRCVFCGTTQDRSESAMGAVSGTYLLNRFTHEHSCIVTKARALVERR